MIKESLRLIAIVLLLIIIVMDDFPFYDKMKNKDTQLFIAVLLIACIYFDTTFGFIMSLVVMLIYYEIYKNIKKKAVPTKETTAKEMPDAFTNEAKEYSYITEEHLFSAQSNVFDEGNMSVEVKMDHGLGSESMINMYGTQGMDAGNLIYKGYGNPVDEQYKALEYV